MPSPLDDLSAEQREAVTPQRGRMLVLGGAGTGKTRVLAARLHWLVGAGVPAEQVLVLTQSAPTADALRATLEDELTAGYDALEIHTAASLAERLLRAEALEAGLDPFFVVATQADRVALLLDRVHDLSLARHEFGGRPSALMASFVQRIDRLKEQLIGPTQYEAQLPEGEHERQREFARVFADHDRMLAEQGTLDAGELVLRACALLRDRPHVLQRTSARFRHLLVDDVQDASPAAMTLLDLLGAGADSLLATADDDQAVGRNRDTSTDNRRELAARHPDLTTVTLTHSRRCPERVLQAATAVVAAIPGRDATPLDGRDTRVLGRDTFEVDVDNQREPRTRGHRAPGAPPGDPDAPPAPAPDRVAFWRCANERSQAQAVAADIERLITREHLAPERIAILVRSIRTEGHPIATALQERAVPHQLLGASAFFERTEVRDVLAWMRLALDPRDAGAVVRALARPPVELRSVDLARVIQIGRRRRLDMVAGVAAALDSPQVPPEARERLQAFLNLHRAVLTALDTTRPDVFVHRLIDRLGLRRQQLFAAQPDVVESLVNLARLGEMAAAFTRRSPRATARELAAYLAAVADAGLNEDETTADPSPRGVQVMSMRAARGREFDHVYVLGLSAASLPDEPPMRRLLYLALTRARERAVLVWPGTSERGALAPASPLVEEARAALGASWQEREEELFGPAETLQSTLRMMRAEVLGSVARIGGRLGELRLDTDLDISHGVVRYLELLKLAALAQRPEGQSVAEALADVDARLLAAATSLEREIFQTSPLNDTLLTAEHGDRARAQAIAARDEPSLEAFLPRRGEGLVLSASDIETYRTCPLKYKFARVFRIPSEPTLNQRFGILVHQVLERFHANRAHTLGELNGLLEAGWRRGGFGDSDQERQLHDKARTALATYHRRLETEPAEPVWFERSFSFRLGPHHLRGRVDRVDRLDGEVYELIDYKTTRPKTAAQLKDDVQLSLYALGARESWQLQAAQQAYYYVLDNEKVPVPRGEHDAQWLSETVFEVADGILAQGFEPTPSFAACSMCDYRIVCPAAEQ